MLQKFMGPVYMESKRLARKQLLALGRQRLDQLATEFVALGKTRHSKKTNHQVCESLKTKIMWKKNQLYLLM